MDFLAQNYGSIIAGAAVLAALALAARKLVRDRRAGKGGCGGNCADCPSCCGKAKDKQALK